MQVANEILNQLGGSKFVAMCGVKNIVGSQEDDYIMFSIPRNSGKANKVKISLMPSDTYKIEFFKIKNCEAKLLVSFDDVYNSNLKNVFESFTGLRTSL